MKYTLLDMTQAILNSLGDDEVNSYSDTSESRQVAEIIRTAYFNILSRANLPEHNKLFRLTASGEDTQPTLMFSPDNVMKIEWIKYNAAEDDDVDEPVYEYVTILPTQQFLDIVHSYNPEEDFVDSFTLNNVRYYYKNNSHPHVCTILEDYYVIFDTYNSVYDTTLQSSKTLCFGQTMPTFTLDDEFTPDLDDHQFPLLLNEAKSLAFLEMKQVSHDLANLESRRQWRTLQRTKDLGKTSDFDKLPNFGRGK